jgi:hypothetical protein
MKRFLLAATVVGVGALLPSAASAAVKQIDLKLDSPTYCIAVDNGPTAATFTVKAPDGTVIQTATDTTATAGHDCENAVVAGDSTFTVSLDTRPGATVVADAGGGVSTTFPVPYGAYDSNGTTAPFKFGALPAAGGTVKIGAGAPAAYSGSTYATPAPVSSASSLVNVVSTVGGVPYLGQFFAQQFYVQASYYGSITAYGVDPLGAPVAYSIAVGGAPFASSSLAPTVDGGQAESARFPLYLPSGSVVVVTQPGWFSHTVSLGTIVTRPTGFDVSVPALAGLRGAFSAELHLQATSGLPSTDPLSCDKFGDATYMAAQCPSLPAARYSLSYPATVTGLDYFYVDTTEADGDTSSVQANARGVVTYLRDGSVEASGLASSQPATLTATTPGHATASQHQVTYSNGFVGWDQADGPNTYLPIKITSGTTFSLSGAAVGPTAVTFSANLEASASGSAVSGTTYPNAHLAIENDRPSGTSKYVYGTANGSGAFSIDVGALLAGDEIDVYAADPVTSAVSVRMLYPGSPPVAIGGVSDQQLVRGTISASATGGGPGGIMWGGDVPGGIAVAAPFLYSLNTTLLPDGPYRLTADVVGLDNTFGDYVYLRIDNTPPTVVAGPDQYVGGGSSAVLVGSASDANGVASLVASFGDGKSLTQPAALIGQPIGHVYAKAGTYKATLTATDAAGNSATSSAVIHVVGTLASQVSGKLPKTLKHKKNLKVKLKAHMAGQLRVRVYDASAKLKGTKAVTFAKANQKATLTLATKKWKRGRYTFVLQFAAANGTPGPIVVQQLRIT